MNETPEGTREKDARYVTGSFDITLNLSQSRGIIVRAHIYSDDTPKELNRRVDEMQDVLDRQAIRVDITSKEAQIAMHRINVENMGALADALIAKRKEGKRLTSTEIQNLNNIPEQLAAAKKQIESLEAAIEAGKAKLAAT